MYTVMIVEDELLVRMGLMASIPWDSLGLRVVAEERSGTDAWHTFERRRPDILITDIRIPGMNGLELMKAVRALDPTCALVVITCVDEFATLQKTISLGIIDYLVKATMRQSDIIDAVKKARAALEKSGRPEADLSRAGRVEALMRGYFLSRNVSYGELMSGCRDDISPLTSGFVLARMSRVGDITPVLRRSMCNILSERLSRLDPITMPRDEQSILVLLRVPAQPQPLSSLLRGVHRYSQEIFGLDVLFCMCTGEIPVKDMPDLAEKVGGFMTESYLYDDAICRINPDGSVDAPVVSECLRALRENIWTLREGDSVARIRERIDRAEEAICGGWVSLTGSVRLLADYVADHTPEISEADREGFFAAMGKEKKLNTLFSLLRERIVAPAIARRRMRPEIAIAIERMSRDLTEKIALAEIAGMVGLHPAYFSRLFEQEMGIGFSGFMTLLRIDKAKILLKDPHLSIQEASDQCGFSDVSYFCRKFKNAVGVTPSAWRMQ